MGEGWGSGGVFKSITLKWMTCRECISSQFGNPMAIRKVNSYEKGDISFCEG